MGRVLVGKPSSLARALVNDLCQKELEGCTCCPAIVLALWRRHLPGPVRAAISHMEFNSNTFDAVCKLADDVFQSNQPTPSIAAVSLDETQPAIPYATPEVAAIRGAGRGGRGGRGARGRGRGNRGGNSGNSGNSANTAGNNSAPRHKGTKHPDLPPGDWKGCGLHFKFGRGAHFCAEPATCPWKDIFSPRPPK